VTQNGAVGGSASASDVDGGLTRLTTPAFDLSGATEATVSFSAWYFCSDAPPYQSNPSELDPLVVEASADGGTTWATLGSITTFPNPNAWTRHSFSLRPALPALTSDVRIRFSIADSPENSITEAGIDEFSISTVECKPQCSGDLSNDGSVDGIDLGMLLSNWGGSGAGDLSGDGQVNGIDLGALLARWGACP
jgi:hypothetical protein